MAVLSNMPFPEPDGSRRARDRLVAISDASETGSNLVHADREDQDQPDRDPVAPDPAGPGSAESDHIAVVRDGPAPVAARAGRLVRRWVPGPLVDARWEPGRPGALMLSLVAALAAVLAAIGVWRDRPVPVPAPPLPLVATAEAADASDRPAAGAPEVVVSVVGRVADPGLVTLPDGARVADALDAAGGALPDTDLLALNLARQLSDGEQILVGVAPPAGQPVDSGVIGAPGDSSVLDLNTATLEQLVALPGVGPVTAQRILDWRAANGRFRSVDQLREVSGIGPSRFNQLKDLVRV